jgi:D-glycero-alpha-D-manno-heptose-7-phosphate kinase
MAGIIRSRSPYRLSYAGGLTDLEEFYENHGGAVIETAVGLYSYATIKERKDNTIRVQNEALGVNEEASASDISKISDFYRVVIKHFSPKKGFDLLLHNDVGGGSGLGASSAVMVAIIGAFNEWLGTHMTPYEIAELAHRLERSELGIYAGKQDPYATVFGGLNLLEFHKGKVVVNSMKLDESVLRELQFRTVLVNTGSGRKTTNTIRDLIKKVEQKDRKALDALEAMTGLAHELKDRIYTGNFDDIAELITKEWEYKKTLVNEISNKQIDELFEFGMKNGAQGGKLAGGGAGGHMLFIVNEESRYKLVKSLAGRGLQVYNPDYVSSGLYTWRSK